MSIHLLMDICIVFFFGYYKKNMFVCYVCMLWIFLSKSLCEHMLSFSSDKPWEWNCWVILAQLVKNLPAATAWSHLLVRTLFWFLAGGFLLCSHKTEGARAPYRISFIRALISFMRALPSWSSHLSKPLSTNTSPFGLWLQYTNSGETQTFRPEQGQKQDWAMGEIKLALWEVLKLVQGWR